MADGPTPGPEQLQLVPPWAVRTAEVAGGSSRMESWGAERHAEKALACHGGSQEASASGLRWLLSSWTFLEARPARGRAQRSHPGPSWGLCTPTLLRRRDFGEEVAVVVATAD